MPPDLRLQSVELYCLRFLGKYSLITLSKSKLISPWTYNNASPFNFSFMVEQRYVFKYFSALIERSFATISSVVIDEGASAAAVGFLQLDQPPVTIGGSVFDVPAIKDSLNQKFANINHQKFDNMK